MSSPSLRDLIQEIQALEARANPAIAEAVDLKELEQVRIEFSGRKSRLATVSSSLKELEEDDRRELGKILNQVRKSIEEAIAKRRIDLAGSEIPEGLDVTLEGKRRGIGFRNPITEVAQDLVEAFLGLGFSVATGPEIETDYYNFQALNIPMDHPARSMFDTLYVDTGSEEMPLFRTHTSPVQIRVMESQPPPVYVVVPGRVARNESVDASHLASFHQIEGLAVDSGISFADMRGVLEEFAKAAFGKDQKVRLIPDYFPFTEPSAGVEVLCFSCGGSGCVSCKKEGWIELMGAGMVHPNVFRAVGYPDDITGFAFGVGIERVAMARYSVPDIRMFYESDLAFLKAF